jgi:hypothetical protein
MRRATFQREAATEIAASDALRKKKGDSVSRIAPERLDR